MQDTISMVFVADAMGYPVESEGQPTPDNWTSLEAKEVKSGGVSPASPPPHRRNKSRARDVMVQRVRASVAAKYTWKSCCLVHPVRCKPAVVKSLECLAAPKCRHLHDLIVEGVPVNVCKRSIFNESGEKYRPSLAPPERVRSSPALRSTHVAKGGAFE